MTTIFKYGLIIEKNKKILLCRKHGHTLFILPGGKPEKDEDAITCLSREITEELGCRLQKESVKFLGTFADVAAHEPNTEVRIGLYSGEIIGTPKPCSEIAELRWFAADDDYALLSPILKNKIMPFLSKINIF